MSWWDPLIQQDFLTENKLVYKGVKGDFYGFYVQAVMLKKGNLSVLVWHGGKP